MAEDDALLNVTGLTVEFLRGRRRSPLRAVDGVSFSLAPRETIGLVGESGSGKSTLGRAILGLVPISEGRVFLAGQDITSATYRQRRALSAELQVVFQDPYSSLNPTRTVGQTLAETLRVHRRDLAKSELNAHVGEMLSQVGLPAEAARSYPSQFSGGQRQRIAIARALMARPRLVICDEPTSALDLSVQAQVLNLLRELQHEFHLSYLFISHDLAVVRHISHRIIVMYQGRIMEQGSASTVYETPAHPYTQALLAAAPVPDPDEQRRRRARIRATPAADQSLRAESCPFVTRCPYAIDICRTRRPRLEEAPGDVRVACHRWSEIRANLVRIQTTTAR